MNAGARTHTHTQVRELRREICTWDTQVGCQLDDGGDSISCSQIPAQNVARELFVELNRVTSVDTTPSIQ